MGSNTRIIAIANRKGGVAKTTTTVNLGAALAALGRSVLLIDLDAQQDLCAALQVKAKRPGLADVLMASAFFDGANLDETFVCAHGMTIVGGYGIEHAERELAAQRGWERTLRRALEPHLEHFDYVLIDCAPSSSGLTSNALAAADTVIVPIQTEFLAANQLPSVMSAVDDIRSRGVNPKLTVSGFLPTMFDRRNLHALSVMEHIATEAHRWGVSAFKPIPRSVRFAEAAELGQPIRKLDADSAPAMAYDELAASVDAMLHRTSRFIRPAPVQTAEPAAVRAFA